MFKADLRQEQQQISYSSSEKDGQQQTAMSHQGESHVLQTYRVQLQQEQVEGVQGQEQQTSVAVPVQLQQLQTYYVSRPELAVTQHQPLDQAQMQQVIQQYKYQEQHARQQLAVQLDQPQLQRQLQVKCVQQQQQQQVGVQRKKQRAPQKHTSQFTLLQQKHQQVQQKNVLHSQQYVQQKTGQELIQLQQQQQQHHKVDADKLQMHVQQLSQHQKLQVHSLPPINQQQQKLQQQQQQKMQVVVVKHKSHQELDADQQQQNLKVQHVLLQHSRQQPGLQTTFPVVHFPTTSEQQVQTTGGKLSLSVDDVAKKIADNVCQDAFNWAVQSGNVEKRHVAKTVESKIQNFKHVENGVVLGQQHKILISQAQQVTDELESKQVSQQMMISQVADKIVTLSDGRMVLLSELQKQQSHCRSTTVINGLRKEQPGVIAVTRSQHSSRQAQQNTVIYSQQQQQQQQQQPQQQQQQQQQQVIQVQTMQGQVQGCPLQQQLPQQSDLLHTSDQQQQQSESLIYSQSPVKQYVVKHPTKNMVMLRNSLHLGTGASSASESVSQNFAVAQNSKAPLPVAVVQPVQLVTREQEMKSNIIRVPHNRTDHQSVLSEQHMTMEGQDNIVVEQRKLQQKLQQQQKLQMQLQEQQQQKLQMQLQEQQHQKLQLQFQEQQQYKLQLQLQDQQQQKLQLQLQKHQQQKLQLQLQEQQQQKLQLQLQEQQQQKLELQLQEQQQQKLQLQLQEQQQQKLQLQLQEQQQQKLQLQLQEQQQQKLQLQLQEQQKFRQLNEQQQQKLQLHQLQELQPQKLLQQQLQEQQQTLQQQQQQQQLQLQDQQQKLQQEQQQLKLQHLQEQNLHQQFQGQLHQKIQLQQYQNLAESQQNFQLHQQKQHVLQHQKQLLLQQQQQQQQQHQQQQHQLQQIEKQKHLQQITQLQQQQHLQQLQHHQQYEGNHFQHQQLEQEKVQQHQQLELQQQLQLQLQQHQLQLVPQVQQLQEGMPVTEFSHSSQSSQAPQSLVLLLHGGENEILGQLLVSIEPSSVSAFTSAPQVKVMPGPVVASAEPAVVNPVEGASMSAASMDTCSSSSSMAGDGTQVERVVKDSSVASVAFTPPGYPARKDPSPPETDVQQLNICIATKCCMETQTKESVFTQSSPVDVPVSKMEETVNNVTSSKSVTSSAVQLEADVKPPSRDVPTSTRGVPTSTREVPTSTRDVPTREVPTSTRDVPTREVPTSTRDVPTREEPRYVAGMLAVCHNCGYLSSDFNKCQRCKKKLPDSVKAISITDMLARCKKTNAEMLEKDVQQPDAAPVPTPTPVATPVTIPVSTPQKTEQAAESSKTSKQSRPPAKKRKTKVIDEPVILTLSSDEEDSQSGRDLFGQNSSATKKAEELFVKDRYLCETKNIIVDTPLGDPASSSVSLHCRTVRIGSYKAVPRENVFISSSVVRMILPSVQNESKYVTVELATTHLKGVLMHFGKSMPVLFYYAFCTVGEKIRSVLGMRPNQEPYFNPESDDETHTRITLLPEKLEEEVKNVLWMFYPTSMRGELTTKTANAILIKSSPRELTTEKPSAPPAPAPNKVKTILIYPSPPIKGGIPISTDDYACLAPDQFLNDVIIDFYLKYLTQAVLKAEDQACTHVFSSFFYKRLTTRPPSVRGRVDPVEDNPSLSPAEKRHSRVKSWTKNVNIFKKKFILIPIVEHMHWFLAVICFPGELGPVRMCDKSPIKKRYTKKCARLTTKKQEKDKQMAVVKENDASSDRDEADGEDEDIDQHSSEDEEDGGEDQLRQESGEKAVGSLAAPSQAAAGKPGKQKKPVREPIKQPCILIFDSLSGTSRVRVVATLRDYLRVEFKVKEGKEREFSKDTMKGACPKVPQQNNFTDCGLYVLQFAEAFFKDPVKDYHIPIRSLTNWFSEEVVSRKREEVCNLLLRLMEENKVDVPSLELPDFGYRSVQEKLLRLASLQTESEVVQTPAAVNAHDSSKLSPTDLATLHDVSKMKYCNSSPCTTLARNGSRSPSLNSKSIPTLSSADPKCKPNHLLLELVDSSSQPVATMLQTSGSMQNIISSSVNSKCQQIQTKCKLVEPCFQTDDSAPQKIMSTSQIVPVSQQTASPLQPIVDAANVCSSQTGVSSNQSVVAVSLPVISVSQLVVSDSQPVVSGPLLVSSVPASVGETSHLVGSESQPIIAVPLSVAATSQWISPIPHSVNTTLQHCGETPPSVSAPQLVGASKSGIVTSQLVDELSQLVSGATAQPGGGTPSDLADGAVSELVCDALAQPVGGVESQPVKAVASEPDAVGAYQMDGIALVQSVNSVAAQPVGYTESQSVGSAASQLVDGAACQSIGSSASKQVGRASSQPVCGVASQPVSGSASQSVGDATSQPVGHLATQPVSGAASQPVSGAASQPVGDLATQPVGDTTSQPVGGLATQPVGDLATQPVGDATSQPIGDLATQPVGDLATQSVGDVATQPVGELATQPVGDVTTQPVCDVATQPFEDVACKSVVGAACQSVGGAPSQSVNTLPQSSALKHLLANPSPHQVLTSRTEGPETPSVVHLAYAEVESSSCNEILPSCLSKLQESEKECSASKEPFSSSEVHQLQSDSKPTPTKRTFNEEHKMFSDLRLPHSASDNPLSMVNPPVGAVVPVSELQKPVTVIMDSSPVKVRTGKKTQRLRNVPRPPVLPRTRSETRRTNVESADKLYAPAPSKRARVNKK